MDYRRQSRRDFLYLLGGASIGLAACSAPPAAAPAPTAGQSAPAKAAGDKAAWEAELEKVATAARQEGQLILSAPPGEDWRGALMAFESAYPGIKVEYSGQWVRDFHPKLVQERSAGQYLWDVRVGGPDPQVFEERDGGMLDPIPPQILLPDVLQESTWFGGAEGLWADKERKHLAAFMATASTGVRVNRDLVPEADFKSHKDLTNPRWKGKIAIDDPRGGSGLGTLAVFHKAYGEEFITDLLTKQELVVTGNRRQLEEWVVRGQYPIGIGAVLGEVQKEMESQGIKVNVEDTGERISMSMGFGAVALINKAPHPNASKLFLNWLLSKSTQTSLSKAVLTNSRRVDVPPTDPQGVVDANNVTSLIDHQDEALLATRIRAQQMANDLLKK